MYSARTGNYSEACEWAQRAVDLTAAFEGADNDSLKGDQDQLQWYKNKRDQVPSEGRS